MKSQFEPRDLGRVYYVGEDENAANRAFDQLASIEQPALHEASLQRFESIPRDLLGDEPTLLLVDSDVSTGEEVRFQDALAELPHDTVVVWLLGEESSPLSSPERDRVDAIYPRSALDASAFPQSIGKAIERRALQRELTLTRKAIDSARHGIVLTDARLEDNPLVFCNTTFYEMTGYAPGEVLGRNCRFLQCEETSEATVDRLRRSISAGESCAVEIQNETKEGELFWNYLSITPIRDRRGKVTHFLGIQEEVSERIERERTLRRQRRELRTYERIVENATDAVSVTDDQGRLVLVNEAFASLFDKSEEALLGRHPRALFSEEFDRRINTDRFQPRADQIAKAFEEQITIDDEDRVFSTVVVPVGETAEDRQTIRIRRELTERRRVEEQLEYRATHDDLTDLYNRPTFRSKLESLVAGEIPALLAFIDIDDFKAINDEYGHAVGDRVLESIATRLRSSVRKEDVAARVGGDEFLLLIPGAGSEQAIEHLADRLVGIFEAPIETPDATLQIDGSIGITSVDPEELRSEDPVREAERLRSAADRAMYRGKEHTGTDWTVFEPEPDAED